MKIAIVSPYDWAVTGGVNRHVANLADVFARGGQDVCIVAPHSRPSANDPEYLTVIAERTFGLPATGSVANVCLSYDVGPRIKRLLERERFDVVHVHEPFMPLVPFQFLRYSQATNIATFHAAREGGSRLYAYSKFIIRPWWRHINGRIAVSRPALRMIGKHFADRYRIIPNGVDCDFFARAKPIKGLADGKQNILFLGRLEKRKGLPTLLEAFALLKRDMPATRLIVVGGDGGLRAGAEGFVESRALTDVVFTGFVSEAEKARYFKSADVYCAPNTGGESMGIILLEAMAAGTPIVASRIEGFEEVLADGEEGLFAPPRDIAALSEALKALLADKERRTLMSQTAAATALQYDWGTVSARILAYYEEAMAGKTTRGA